MTYTWTVPTSGDYIFLCYSAGASFLSLVPYYLNITNSNGTVIAQRVDIVRFTRLWKLIYIGNVTNITVNCTGCSSFTLEQLSPVSFFLNATISEFSAAVDIKNYKALAPGYYAIRIISFSPAIITYESDYFACPYE